MIAQEEPNDMKQDFFFAFLRAFFDLPQAVSRGRIASSLVEASGHPAPGSLTLTPYPEHHPKTAH